MDEQELYQDPVLFVVSLVVGMFTLSILWVLFKFIYYLFKRKK